MSGTIGTVRWEEREMTLTIGTGPFGDQGDKSFNFEVRAPVTTFCTSRTLRGGCG